MKEKDTRRDNIDERNREELTVKQRKERTTQPKQSETHHHENTGQSDDWREYKCIQRKQYK